MRSAKEYRNLAYEALDGNWKSPILAGLVLTAINLSIQIISALTDKIPGMAAIMVFLTFAVMICIWCPLEYGFNVGCLKLFRKENPYVLKQMISEFTGNYTRAATSYLLQYLYVMLIAIPLILLALVLGFAATWIFVKPNDFSAWLSDNTFSTIGILYFFVLLCLIPAIVYSYSIYLTPYIVHDHPEMSVQESLKLSRKWMQGRKWNLFCLQLSFIGWAFLAILTFGIGMIFLLPYQTTATAAFYNDIAVANQPAEETVVVADAI